MKRRSTRNMGGRQKRPTLFNEAQHLYHRMGALQDICTIDDHGHLIIDLDRGKTQPSVMAHYFCRLADKVENLRKLPILIRENGRNRPIRDVVFSPHKPKRFLKQITRRSQFDQHHLFVFFDVAGHRHGDPVSQPFADDHKGRDVHIVLYGASKHFSRVNGLMLMTPAKDLAIRHTGIIPLKDDYCNAGYLCTAVKRGFLKPVNRRTIRQQRIDDWMNQPRFI